MYLPGARRGVVGSTIALGSIGHGFEAEHRLFSHHSSSGFCAFSLNIMFSRFDEFKVLNAKLMNSCDVLMGGPLESINIEVKILFTYMFIFEAPQCLSVFTLDLYVTVPSLANCTPSSHCHALRVCIGLLIATITCWRLQQLVQHISGECYMSMPSKTKKTPTPVAPSSPWLARLLWRSTEHQSILPQLET